MSGKDAASPVLMIGPGRALVLQMFGAYGLAPVDGAGHASARARCVGAGQPRADAGRERKRNQIRDVHSQPSRRPDRPDGGASGGSFSKMEDAMTDPAAYVPSLAVMNPLVELFRERWPGVEPELTPEERVEYRGLCLPESPDFILNAPDYYACWTNSMFRGSKEE
jgi:hypothetical protein